MLQNYNNNQVMQDSYQQFAINAQQPNSLENILQQSSNYDKNRCTRKEKFMDKKLDIQQTHDDSESLSSQHEGPRQPNQEQTDQFKKVQENKKNFRRFIMKSTKKQKKNTNFGKFLISNFQKYAKLYSNEFSKEQLQFINAARNIYDSKGRRNITIQALSMLFGKSEQFQKFMDYNRIFMSNILGKKEFITNSICFNSFVLKHNQKQILLATKIYRLRCRSRVLISRIQSK